MSVIIKGAYPPIDCESCSYRGIVKCSPNYYSGTIPAGCPVYGLPSHGRLIDADKIPERYAEVRDLAPTVIEAEGE